MALSKEQRQTWVMLANELQGIYIETDKLARKSPATAVSDLELQSVNRLIKLVKKSLKGDLFVDSLTEFVPAGDNAQYREVVLVLRQMIQAMNRHAPEYEQIVIK